MPTWPVTLASADQEDHDEVVTGSDWVNLVSHALWPLTTLVVVIVLRRQIGDLLSGVAGRVTKVTVLSVSIELAAATEAAPLWKGIGGDDIRGLVSAQLVNDSYFGTLRQSLKVPGPADFFMVDLKSEGRQEWLTSRLYLFTYILSQMKGVQVVVFVRTRDDMSRTFLGIADAADLIRVLGAAEPWLRLARMEAEASVAGQMPSAPAAAPAPMAAFPETPLVPRDLMDWWQEARQQNLGADPLWIANRFVDRIQWSLPPGQKEPPPDDAWLRLPSRTQPATWEHASWVTVPDLVDGRLSAAVTLDSFVLDDLAWSDQERTQAILRVSGQFVALLGAERRFRHLVGRQSLLEGLSTNLLNPPSSG